MHSNPGLIFLTLLVLLLYTLVGRLVTAHAGDRAHSTTPFISLLAGLGLWSLFWLFLGGFVGASYNLVFLLFVGGGLALVLGMFRVFYIDAEAEHYFTQPFMGLLILLPLLLWASSSLPHLPSDTTLTLKHGLALLTNNGFTNLHNLGQFAEAPNSTPLGHIWALTPLAIVLPSLPHAIWPIAQVVLLVITAGALLQAGGLKLKWSNLPLLTGAALLGVLALNPFFSVELLFSSSPHLWVAAAVLALALPVIDPHPLPRGLATLPSALVACWLTVLHPAGLFLAGIILAWWLVRLVLESANTLRLKDIFGLSLLVCLPLITWLLWRITLSNTGVEPLWPTWVWFSTTTTSAAGQLIYLLLDRPLASALTITILANAARQLIAHGPIAFFTRMTPQTLPAALVVVYLFGIASQLGSGGTGKDLELGLIHLQFVLLLPLWQLTRTLWRHFGFEQQGFRHPWLIGVALLALVIGHVWLQRGHWPLPPTAEQIHVQKVGTVLRRQLPGGQAVAVLDQPQSHGQAAHILRYHLVAHTPVVDISPVWHSTTPTRGGLHQALRESKLKYLWLHAPDAQQQRLLNSSLQPNRSYLFEVTEQGLHLQTTYPHPAYTTVQPTQWRYP